jgi:hypothetical protein
VPFQPKSLDEHPAGPDWIDQHWPHHPRLVLAHVLLRFQAHAESLLEVLAVLLNDLLGLRGLLLGLVPRRTAPGPA